MSIKSFKDTIYNVLPSKNIGFVEGGVFISPGILGLTLPSSMDENDMYRYLSRYVRVMDALYRSKDEEDGRKRTRKIAEKMQVPAEKFMKDSEYIYMTESVMRDKVLPKTFESIKDIYMVQARRGRVILLDIMDSVDKKTKEKIIQMDESLTNNLDEEKQSISDYNQKVMQNSKAILDDIPEEKFELSNPIIEPKVEPKVESSSIFMKAKTFVTNPPILLGIAAILGYSLLPKKSKDEGYVS